MSPDSLPAMKDLLHCKTQAELFDKLAHLRCQPPLSIRVFVGGSKEPVQELARRCSPFPLRIRDMNDFSVGEFSYSAGELRLNGAVFFCPTPRTAITYLISVCSGIVWQRSVLRLAHSLYPKLVPVFFSQRELLNLLKQAKRILPDSELRIIGHTRKKRLKAGSRRKYESSRTRTEKPLEVVFTETEEQSYWFNSVSFEYLRSVQGIPQDDATLASATLSKYGTFFCTSHFDRFLHGTLNDMAAIAEEKMKFFSNRSRRLTPRFEPHPISITYDSPEFVSLTDSKNFVSIMRRMPRISCSVLHDNPYVHLSVVDSTDGSAADVWVLKNDEILLVPQLKASEAALKRFVNYIFEEWREGSVASPTPADAIQPPAA